MGTISIRIDDALKEQSFTALERLGITPSELLRQSLLYVVQNQKLPFSTLLVNDEDAKLIAIAKKRLEQPQAVKVSIDEL
jgi:RHH-type rel operon transcriptional repressor/antitoxin RelB